MRHDLIDRRSLELNRLVAEKIRQHPELMVFVRSNLDHSLSEPRLSNSCKDALREWQTIFSLKSFYEILVEDSDEGQRLRQSTPFTGILSQMERGEIFRRYESAGACAHCSGRRGHNRAREICLFESPDMKKTVQRIGNLPTHPFCRYLKLCPRLSLL